MTVFLVISPTDVYLNYKFSAVSPSLYNTSDHIDKAFSCISKAPMIRLQEPTCDRYETVQ